MKNIVIVGATGNLGGKIVTALANLGAQVKAIVRPNTSQEKIKSLLEKGVNIHELNLYDTISVTKVCKGSDCVISALAGLKDTIIDQQKLLLNACIAADVPRFIPSDYSIDFTYLQESKNRNLDWRRDFHKYLDQKEIKSTTIFNGAFMNLLTTDMPLILPAINRILCWGNPDIPLDFTTSQNVADFTARVALDQNTPRYLRVAGDRMSPRQFVDLLSELTGNKYKLLRPGNITLFNSLISFTKLVSPGKKELYPAWQGMQYMRDMMEGKVMISKYDNTRYPDLSWTSIKEFLQTEFVIKKP